MEDNKKIQYSVMTEGNIYEHLALEDYLFEHAIPSLLLYINSPVVVIGKHQNPWIETDPMKYPFARRQSGGGSVYHDEGNLNYSVILPKEDYDRDKIFQIIQSALLSLSIETELTTGFSIFHKGKKVSGSAFRQNSRTVLHHGTLLVNTDLLTLKSALKSPYSYEDVRSTKSNASPVINLNEINSNVSVAHVIQSVIKGFSTQFHMTELSHDDTIIYRDKLLKYRNRHRSSEWLFGDTLPYFHFFYRKSMNNTSIDFLGKNKHIILEDAYEKAGISQ